MSIPVREKERDSSEFCHSNDMTSNELAFCFCLFVNRTRPSDKIIYVLKLRSDEMMIQYAEYVGAQLLVLTIFSQKRIECQSWTISKRPTILRSIHVYVQRMYEYSVAVL